MCKKNWVYVLALCASMIFVGCGETANIEVPTESSTTLESEKETEQKPEEESEKESEQKPEKETEKAPEKESEQKPEKESEQKLEKETEKAPEKESEQKPEKESEKESEQKPEKGSEKEPEKESEKESEQKSEKETEKESETESEPVSEEDTSIEEECGISIEPVEGLSKDFLFGCDMSTVIAQENSGVVYYDEKGERQDPLLTLAENGVNMIRVRVWNNPYDEDGNGYGGGNCDTANAIAIGKRVTEYNMTMFIDYHYSDFWCDPSKQMCPKAWVGMTIEEKTTAIYDYTKQSLGDILKAGVDVSLVQIGNEITSGMAGETDWKNICKLLNSASKAIRELAAEYETEIQIAVHFTNPEKGRYGKYAKTLHDNNVDYDVFATSYYSFWHGTLDNLKKVLGEVANTYDKKVMVAEISYAYTYADGDGHGNTIHQGAWGEFSYEVSEQGQADAVRDCVEALATLGDAAIGLCYWEPAWIPVPGNSYNDRAKLWEKYGSGWASSYAGEYDPKDAGMYYGGSAWDNQALFDNNGHPLDSINMFEMMR